MERINDAELKQIIASYGLSGLVPDKYLAVEPDTALYFFKNTNGDNYVLIAADYLGGYDKLELPYEFDYDFYPGREVNFTAVERIKYIDGAPSAVTDHIDDGHYLTKSRSTGDVCMLFRVG